jgi:hypothetical protein
MDKQKVQKVQQDQASDESESFFDKFLVISCCTGWGTTKSVEADPFETPKTATTDGPVTTEPACDENYPSELSTVPEEEVDSQYSVVIQNQYCKGEGDWTILMC